MHLDTTMEQRTRELSIFIHKNYPAHSQHDNVCLFVFLLLFSFAIKKTMTFIVQMFIQMMYSITKELLFTFNLYKEWPTEMYAWKCCVLKLKFDCRNFECKNN